MIRNLVAAITRIDAVREKLESAKKAFEQLTGIEQLKAETEEAVRKLNSIASSTKSAKESLVDEKQAATVRNEPWVAVLDTKFNPENPRNGFFELDWNDLFVEQLRRAGYGTEHDPEEEIVDRWFRDLAYQMLIEAEQDPNRGAGLVNLPNQDTRD